MKVRELKFWRRPVVHFLLIGMILFGLDHMVSSMRILQRQEREPIRITQEKMQEIRSEFMRQTGRWPTHLEIASLKREAIDDEIFVREAKRLHLDRGDETVRLRLLSKLRILGEAGESMADEELFAKAMALKLDEDTIIRRHLIHKMRILLARSTESEVVSAKEIQTYLEQNRENYARPQTVTFAHVFVKSKSARDLERARILYERLRSKGISPDKAQKWSDPFPLGLSFSSFSEPLLQRRFGPSFAAQVLQFHTGEWAGPLESPFGVHLVWVKEIDRAAMPPVEEVRSVIERKLVSERSIRRIERALKRLRELYPVEVES